MATIGAKNLRKLNHFPSGQNEQTFSTFSYVLFFITTKELVPTQNTKNVILIQFCFLTFEHILLNVQFCCVSLKLGLHFVAKIVEGTKDVPFHVLQPWLVTTWWLEIL